MDNHPAALPPEFKKYFWDCDFTQLTLREYAFFITERILVYGDLPALQWVMRTAGMECIRRVVRESRNLDKKTINFWELMLNAG
jgi:hypothetical protein